ncbi:uncharacterized protein LOC125501694 [Athalia rosae]|nr:uncharacterized protein LOC125501694 [Athalia rosae]
MEIDTGSGETNNCPACANGDLPSGAHTCALCGKAVHVLEMCSGTIGNDEGYGEKRICKDCQKLPRNTVETVVDSGFKENWRGLSTTVQKRGARYLQRDYTANEFIVNSKITKVPVLKGGSFCELKSVNVGGRKLSLIRTCAFDSIFQIFLAAVLDSDAFKEKASDLATRHLFFKMILDTSDAGINKNTYYLRAKILSEVFTQQNSPNNCYLINCETTSGPLCLKLFKSIVGIQEISTCVNGCLPRVNDLIQVNRKDLLRSDYRIRVEEGFVISDPKQCPGKDCDGEEMTTLSVKGGVVIFETYDLNLLDETSDETFNPTSDETRTYLRQIPKSIRLSFMESEFDLRGIVHFTPPKGAVMTRSPQSTAIGHYTAFCRRRDGSWWEYDDCKKAGQKVSEETIVNLQLVIFTC